MSKALRSDPDLAKLTDELVHLRVCLSLGKDNDAPFRQLEELRTQIFELERRVASMRRRASDITKQARKPRNTAPELSPEPD